MNKQLVIFGSAEIAQLARCIPGRSRNRSVYRG
jgi:hypothetical protein